LRCGGLLRELRRLTREALAALRRRRTLVPRDIQPLPRGADRPPGVANDRYAAEQPGQAVAALDHERVPYTRHRADLVEVRARDLPAEHGALHELGVQHAGQRDVDAVERPASHDRGPVHVANVRTDDREVTRILERHVIELRRRHGRGALEQIGVPRTPTARAVVHHAALGRQLARRHAPHVGGRGDEHLPRGRADPAHRQPVLRCRVAAARELAGEAVGVEWRLLDPDAAPLDVELVGDQHRQHRLHALPDLRVLRDDRDHAVRHHPDERVRCELAGAV
jgi:hypothetical protein